MKTKIIIAIALFIVSSASVSAQNNSRGMRDENRRIRNGYANGQLTTPEAARLKMQQARLRNEALRYKMNDGRIGPRERADLRKDQRKLNRNICRQKHDRQRRF